MRTDLKSEEVTNLPLNQFRNYQSLVVLVPGSLPPTFQNAETDTPQRSSGGCRSRRSTPPS